MLNVFGIAPVDLLTAPSLVEFPPFVGREVGGSIPMDCKVGLVELNASSLMSSLNWHFTPPSKGYVVVVDRVPFIALKNHIRQIRVLHDMQGQSRVWPWFDPRYMKMVLNSMTGRELAHIFGPIQTFGFAIDGAIELYQQREGLVQVRQVSS